MREVTIHKNNKTTVKITSPWRLVTEAASYPGISRAKFYSTLADTVPCKGFGSVRCYHVDQIDKNDYSTSGK